MINCNQFLGVALLLVFIACSKVDSNAMDPITNQQTEPQETANTLTAYQQEVIRYFKDIALGFEFGNATRITRKWTSDLRVYVGGEANETLIDELERIKNEINELTSDDFSISIVNDSLQSNYYVFLGSADDYAAIYPSQANLVGSNWGLFSIFWNANNVLFNGHMYVDTERANVEEQKHLLREEFTQSLGLARDSNLYSGSIFQSAWTSTTEYLPIDRDVIRLLYHPQMQVGLDSSQVESVLETILLAE